MPADTLSSMILGFSVILFILGAYGLSLVIRTRRAKRRIESLTED